MTSYEPTTAAQELSTRAALLAWSLWSLSVALVALGIVLLAAGLDGTHSPYWLNNGVAASAFSTVGAVVAARLPKNPIGWLFGVVGLLYGLAIFADGYGAYALSGNSVPAAGAARWIASWLWVPSGSLVLFSLLIFPDGRLPSPRWRIPAWLFAVAATLATASFALSQGPFGEEPGLVVLLSELLLGAVGAGALACVAALFARFHRSKGVERQQLKWVAYAAGVLLVAVVASSVSRAVDESLLGRLLFLAGFLAVPGSIGIAILKYRLYDIDLSSTAPSSTAP